MLNFKEALKQFEDFLAKHTFPNHPKTLYEPCSYLLNMGGKRIRPVLCLMSHELFAPLSNDVWNAATAIELFHNFTLMHDDIMDKAPLRRGFQTVHEKFNLSTAILSGDVMNIFAYHHLNQIQPTHLPIVLGLFNRTAIEICEGQQYDMDFEKLDSISTEAYLKMITLKTSVLLGMAMQIGAMLGGATDSASSILYQFGKEMGIAFQMKDDYLDIYGNPEKTGKKIGGDIMSNKKTFLSTKSLELANPTQKETWKELQNRNDEFKLKDTLSLYESLQVKDILQHEIEIHTQKAYALLEKVPVISKRKIHLQELTETLLNREF